MDFIDEGHRRAGIGEQATRPVRRLAVGGIGFAAEVRVAREHHAAVRVVLAEQVGTGTDGVPVEREVPLGHARLAVEALGLPRHRREEWHREPIDELWITLAQGDLESVVVDDPRTLEFHAA